MKKKVRTKKKKQKGKENDEDLYCFGCVRQYTSAPAVLSRRKGLNVKIVGGSWKIETREKGRGALLTTRSE